MEYMKYKELVNWNTNKIKKERFDDYAAILKYNSDYKLNVVSFKQALYNLLNNIKEPKKCICNKELDFLDINRGYRKFCSSKCASNNENTIQKRKETVLKLYNVNNVAELEFVKNKRKSTNLKRHGVEYPSQSKIISEKIKLKLKNKKIYNSLIEEFKSNTNDIILFDTILIKKESFLNFINLYSKEELEPFIKILLILIRENITEFFYPSCQENLENIFNAVIKFNKERIILNNIFKNSGSSKGTLFLKSIFKSFYSSSFKRNLTPIQFFNSDKTLKNILKYRIGINNSNEVFDLSFKNIIKGISAIRGTISFFKPSVAAKIYEYFLVPLNNKEKVTVLDPCMGFGGRMLGFFIQFPKGRYIGCEPNKQTFSELVELKNKISEYLGYEINTQLYNVTIEEFSSKHLNEYKKDIDLTFTSIPYYDLECYSEDIVSTNYNSFEDWKDKFINCIFSLPNCLINLPIDLYDKCPEIHNKVSEFYYLENTAAKHFNKKSSKKIEYILKCF